MAISILGAGNVGMALAKALTRRGERVRIGVPDPEKHRNEVERLGARVVALATLIGFDAVDCGGLPAARYLEPFAMAWIHTAIKLGHGRRFAFSRLKR